LFGGGIDPLSRLRADFVSFAVHDVFLECFGLHGPKGADSHMQGQAGDADTLLLQLLKQGSVKVQAGRRGGHGARPASINSLIAGQILLRLLSKGVAPDIRGQGGRADVFEDGLRRFLRVGPEEPLPLFEFLLNLQRFPFPSLPIEKCQSAAGLEVACVFQQDLPAAVRCFFKKKPLYPGTGLFSAEKAGRQNFGIVENQTIARLEILRQVAKMAVFEPAVGAVKHEQPRLRTPLGRMLSNQFFRQVIFQLVCSHRAETLSPPAGGDNDIFL